MLRLNKKVEYALISLLHIDREGMSSARELAKRYMIPSAILGKVMQQLAKADLVASVKGAQGGYELLRSLETINLRHVTEAIEGPVELTACQGSDCSCDQFSLCTIREPLSHMQEKLNRFIEDIQVSELRDLQESSNLAEIQSTVERTDAV